MFKMRVNYVETGHYFSKQLDVLLLKHTFFFCKSLSASHYGIPLCSDRKIYFRHSALYLGTLDASAVELGET